MNAKCIHFKQKKLNFTLPTLPVDIQNNPNSTHKN